MDLSACTVPVYADKAPGTPSWTAVTIGRGDARTRWSSCQSTPEPHLAVLFSQHLRVEGPTLTSILRHSRPLHVSCKCQAQLFRNPGGGFELVSMLTVDLTSSLALWT